MALTSAQRIALKDQGLATPGEFGNLQRSHPFDPDLRKMHVYTSGGIGTMALLH